MNIQFSKPFRAGFAWWKRNLRDKDGKVDTSRVMGLAVMWMVVTFVFLASTVYIIQAVQFFQQWLGDAKTYKLMLDGETNKNLAIIVGIIAGAVRVEYRAGKWLNGKNGK